MPSAMKAMGGGGDGGGGCEKWTRAGVMRVSSALKVITDSLFFSWCLGKLLILIIVVVTTSD